MGLAGEGALPEKGRVLGRGGVSPGKGNSPQEGKSGGQGSTRWGKGRRRERGAFWSLSPPGPVGSSAFLAAADSASGC